jgi:hypothetical protein
MSVVVVVVVNLVASNIVTDIDAPRISIDAMFVQGLIFALFSSSVNLIK